MARVTNITRTVTERRLGLTPKQQEALDVLGAAFDNLYQTGMGAKEIAVVLQDIGPAAPTEIHQWQPFGFAALYFDDELFSAFMKGDPRAREEATLGSAPSASDAGDSEYAPPGTSSLHKSPSS